MTLIGDGMLVHHYLDCPIRGANDTFTDLPMSRYFLLQVDGHRVPLSALARKRRVLCRDHLHHRDVTFRRTPKSQPIVAIP